MNGINIQQNETRGYQSRNARETMLVRRGKTLLPISPNIHPVTGSITDSISLCHDKHDIFTQIMTKYQNFEFTSQFPEW
jgi:hypothetical protein